MLSHQLHETRIQLQQLQQQHEEQQTRHMNQLQKLQEERSELVRDFFAFRCFFVNSKKIVA